MGKGLLLLASLVLWVAEAGATFEREYVLTTWDTDAGSPFIAVTAIAQTPDGYLWLGSYEGMARFDGVRFEHDTDAVFPRRDALVLSLVVDESGDLWAGTSQGIWRRQGKIWEQLAEPNGLVYSITTDSSGLVVALMGSTVMRWDGKAFVELPTPPLQLNTLSQHVCFFDSDDRLWLSGRRFLGYLVDGTWEIVRMIDTASPAPRVLGAGAARNGGIWFAEDTMLKRFHHGEIVETKPRMAGHQFDEVGLWEDAAGNLWEAGERNGLVIHKQAGPKLTCTVDDGLSNNVIIAINADREGNVWLGSDGGGIARVRPRSLIAHADRRALSQAVVNSVVVAGPSDLLVGTHGGGVLRFENGEFSSPISAGGPRPLDNQSWVQVIQVDPDGGQWFGTYQNGLHYLNGEKHLNWLSRDLGGNHVYALHRDANEQLWIGTEKGLVHFDGDRLTHRPAPETDWGVIAMIADDEAGSLWVANRAGDLWRRNGTTFNRITELAGMALGRVLFLHQDESDRLWITTDQNTLWHEHQGDWVRYDHAVGLPTGTWKPIAADDEGYRWFGSDRGVMRITTASLEAVADAGEGQLNSQILNQVDGMKSPRVRNGFQQIGARSADGRIWIATIKGLVELDPQSIRIPALTPKIHIEQVRDGPRLIRNTILPDDVITIPAGTERVNIRYTGTSVSYGEFLNYRYRLDGVDGDWVPAGNEPIARLTGLSPGEYLFRVGVLSLEGQTANEAQVTLIVEPFWWQRWDVRLLALGFLVAFIIVAVTIAVRSRYIRQRERLEQARALAEERLRTSVVTQEMEVATEANLAKSDFLATMSHEIRTPLNGVIGSMDLMIDTPLTNEQREHMATLNASAETLLAVLNDILDFSKIEAGKITIEREAFDLSHVLREVMEVATPRALAKGIELALIIPPAVPLWVVGDAARLRQVLINLVGNAVKFTDLGSVAVRLDLLETEPAQASDQIQIRFRVEDTGVGIDPTRQAQLFDRFTQADASTTRKYGGTGLGLAICKRLVELMGGEIGVTSRYRQGAEFFFTITYAPTPPLSDPINVSMVGDAIVLDDTPTALEAEVTLLNRHGVAAYGTESIDGALARLESQQQVCFFLDESRAQSFTQDQIERLSQRAKKGGLSIILMSMKPNQRTEFSKIETQATLRKPVLDAESILRCLQPVREAEEQAKEETVTTESPVSSPAKAHILLADDEPVNRLVLGKILRRLGYTLDLAENGAEAVALAKLKDYSAILMDCRMPVMDGYTATSEIKKYVKNAPPIIAVTANTTVEDRARCTAVGMVDFISKPVRGTELDRVLKEWI